MGDETIELATKDGTMETFVAIPDGKGPFPGVVMYQNIGGLSDSMRGMARRMAANGYLCCVPALYYRFGTIVVDPDNLSDEVKPLRALLTASLRNTTRIMEDTRHVLEWMGRDSRISKGAKGCIGYCAGGRFSLVAAGTFPEAIKATTSLFPGNVFGDGAHPSPDAVVDKIRGEVYCGFAEHDHLLPLDKVEAFRVLLEQRCTARWTLDVPPGTHHGYAFPGRAVYHEAAAELAWTRTFEMFGRQLGH